MARTLTLLLIAVASSVPLLARAGEPKTHFRLQARPAAPAPAAPAAHEGEWPPGPGIALPVREVTVYSDRARVVRAGEVALGSGQQRVVLPTLPPTVDAASVQVTAHDAALRRVEVRRRERNDLPRTRAQRLLREWETTVDQRDSLMRRHQTLEEERALLQSVLPRSEPRPSPERPPEPLDPTGWRAAAAFLDARTAEVDDRVRALDEQIASVQKTLARLAVEARLLSAGLTGQPGYEVVAFIEGRGGPARLELSYLARNARWYPAYDIHHVAGSGDVEVGFSGLVSQSTGEDWSGAQLVLSTAVPATTCALPQLTAWKIGDRDQFVPTPRAKPQPPMGAPPPVPQPRLADLEDEQLRAALEGIAREGNARAGMKYPAPAEQPAKKREKRKEVIDFNEEAIEGELTKPEGAYTLNRAPGRANDSFAPAAAPPPQAYSEVATIQSTGSSAGASRPQDYVSFGAPAGWRPPAYAADLPAALAGGYEFTYRSARAETVRTGGEVRRVALHAAKFPARMVVTVFPAIGKQAYLVAEVTNNSERPLLRGSANLFVGADLQGQALLETAAVGETMQLPLGVDEAVQLERNVKVVTEEKGLFSKKDVTRYRVTIELLNPHARALEARVADAVPLQGNKEVEVEFAGSTPAANFDKAGGRLEWQLTLPPTQKVVLTYEYVLTRPRGAKLQQW